jgi:hypothetical protein
VTRVTPWGYVACDEDGAPAGSEERVYKVVTGDTNIFELAPIARQPAALYVIAITAHTRRRRDGG